MTIGTPFSILLQGALSLASLVTSVQHVPTNVQSIAIADSRQATALVAAAANYQGNNTTIGNLDGVTVSGGRPLLQGWAFDRLASSTSIDVQIFVDNAQTPAATVTTNSPRPDVNTAWNITGTHGFLWPIPVAYQGGTHTFSVYAIDAESHASAQIFNSPQTLSLPTPTPIGYFDVVADSNGTSYLNGWAYDPRIPSSSISVKVVTDGSTTPADTFQTATLRTDVNTSQGITGLHGYQWPIPAFIKGGPHIFSIYAIDPWTSANVQVFHSPVTLSFPRAVLDMLTSQDGQPVLQGWAFDPLASSTSIDVQLFVDSTSSPIATINASSTRTDVNSDWKITGGHGFFWPIPLAYRGGVHTFWARAISQSGSLRSALSQSPMTLTVPLATSSGSGPVSQAWFTAGPEIMTANGLVGAPDYQDLFTPTTTWPIATNRTRVFIFLERFMRYGTDAQLKQAIDYLKSHNIAIGFEHGLLPAYSIYGPACTPMEGHGDTEQVQFAQRIKNLGGTVSYLSADSPLYSGYSEYPANSGCNQQIATIAAQAASTTRAVRAIFPNIKIVDVESVNNIPGTPSSVANLLGQWHAAYAQAAGQPFSNFIFDMNWYDPSWQSRSTAIVNQMKSEGMPFGTICDGYNASVQSDTAWNTQAIANCKAFTQLNGQPDTLLFETWFRLPDHMLPETDPGSFTSLVNSFFTQ